MSDKSSPFPETPVNPPAEGSSRVRRISNPRIKKPAKVATAPDRDADAASPGPAKESPRFPEFLDAPDSPSLRTDWPEPDADSGGTSAFPENPKRKRRRKKGKGTGPHNTAPPGEGENSPPMAAEPSEGPVPQATPQPPRPSLPPRTKIDAELLAERAWKIYLSEVSEEGVALIGDNDAKELARRCFRLAEIFIEEHGRRR